MDTVMQDVVYKDIEGYEGYRVGSDGSVWSRRLPIRGGRMGDTWKRLKPILRRGYLRAALRTKNNRANWIAVHHLVLNAFVGKCPEGMEACHYPDPDKTNNSLNNLRWDTRQANSNDSIRLGRITRGEFHKCAKVSEQDVRDIRSLVANGMSRRKAAAIYGLSNISVNAIVNRTTWKHVA
jgi:hypothetical protein